jgi:hypothetical protein
MTQMIRLWRELVAAAAVVFAAGAQFVQLPPEDGAAKALAMFCLAALVSIAYAAMRKTDHPRYLWTWAAVTVMALVGVIAVHNYYSSLFAALTVPYAGERRVIGTIFTPTGKAYAEKFPHKTRADLLFDASGSAVQVWTESSIQASKDRLRYVYLLCAPLIGATVVASTQVASLARKRRPGRKKA